MKSFTNLSQAKYTTVAMKYVLAVTKSLRIDLFAGKEVEKTSQVYQVTARCVCYGC